VRQIRMGNPPRGETGGGPPEVSIPDGDKRLVSRR
jgi:hypothetical protein